jgi:hypothetical protein
MYLILFLDLIHLGNDEDLFTEKLLNVTYVGVFLILIFNHISTKPQFVFFLLLPALPVSWIGDISNAKAVASNIGWATEVMDDG